MLNETFYTVYSPGTPYSGGGIWDWGGASLDSAGNVYGTTYQGGTNENGLVFEITP